MTYVYDPEVAAAVPYAPSLDVSDVSAARRLIANLVAAAPKWTPADAIDYVVVDIEGPGGDPLGLHLLRPATGVRCPCALLWFHGGGFVLGDATESLPFLERIVVETGALVASVQYRLAPENPYPAAVDDGHTALAWVRERAADLSIEPNLTAVGGSSAGGAVAAGLALRERDEGRQLLFQALEIPVLDDRQCTESSIAYVDTLTWDRANATASWKAYLRGTAGPTPAYAAPARAEDLGGLPPTFIAINQYDPLRDEAIEYARRLAHANVAVEMHLYAGTFHGSSSIAAAADVSRRQEADLRSAVTRAFARAVTHQQHQD